MCPCAGFHVANCGLKRIKGLKEYEVTGYCFFNAINTSFVTIIKRYYIYNFFNFIFKHRQDMKPEDAEIVVVLTGGMRYSGKEIGWMPEVESYQRLMAGLEVHRKMNSRTPILISGGKTAGTHYPSEAAVLKATYDKENARILPFILEEVSTNTYENALQSAHIISSRALSRVLLVTSEEHMLRSLAAFRGRGIDPLPLRVYTMDRGPLTLRGYLPTFKGVKTNAKALYEIYGMASYLIADHIRHLKWVLVQLNW